MDKSGEDSNGLRLGKFEKRRTTIFKFRSVFIQMSFTQLENHYFRSQLLFGRGFENERLDLPI